METSTIDLKWIAVKGTSNCIQELQDKLCMICIHMDRHAKMFYGNESFVRNQTIPESALKMEHVAIRCPCVCYMCALGIHQIAKADGATKLANSLTKNLPGPL